MKRLSHTVIKNALVNTTRLGVGAAVALVLPPTLTRLLDRDQFAAWVLLLQIAAYANYFDFGIQTAVARFVAQAMERGDEKERDGYISTAFFLLVGAGILAFALLCVMAWLAPAIFKQAPLRLIAQLRAGLILLAAFSALALPTSAFAGVFVGLHKNEFPALASGCSRLLGAALVILAVHRTHSLVVMAGLIGGSNLLGGLFLFLQARRVLPTMLVSFRSISKRYLASLSKFCGGLTVWSFAMFFIGGLDLTIVGYFRFSGVAYYSVASTLVMILSGLGGAATSALITPTAAIHALGDYDRLGAIVLRTTRHVTQLGVLLTFVFIVFGVRILTLWVGPVYAQNSRYILDVLAMATAIRLLGGPYSAALIGTGKHVGVVFSPLFEAGTNLLVSVTACYYIGPIGVALGTLVGAIAAISLMIWYYMPRISEVRINPAAFLIRAVVRPAIELAPALGGLYIGISGTWLGVLPRLLIAIGGIALTWLIYRPYLQLGAVKAEAV